MKTQQLQRRITRREAVIGVVGQGYVGLSLAASAAVEGMTVRAVDVDTDRIQQLAAGSNVVPGVDDALFANAVEAGRLFFGTDAAALADCDVVVICVPTPVVEHRPDLRFIEDAGRAVAGHLRRDSLVVLESTTYPGTTEQVLRPLLEAHGLRAGRDFLLAYSPERIDPGNVKYGLRNTPRVVGGIDEPSSQTAGMFYDQLVDEVEVLSSCRAAEMAKLLENTFRMVNIALVNELATLCSEQQIDVWEVIRAAATKPFGFMPFYPGPGVGGHCIPLDPTYLAWQSRRDTGRPFRLVETAQDINAHMPTYVTSRVIEALSDHGKAVKGANILALGVTYKPDVGDLRESAAIEVLARLVSKGAKVTFHDPFVTEIREHGLSLRGSSLSRTSLAAADIVLLLTPHSTYDVDMVAEHAKLLFDARNATNGSRRPTVVTL
ncbi:nucleotide sugar dehydrogenase [Blastococcus saxobsidens]|uniref:UDP-glucose 6-dehydrogenase n=1 Tax=Blastococcus saxobsidens (strain DD2) TaxID=1146883 RepID=H6RM81_BLASD|nr:nucleotide sugar dehydrogenase [Blastococcus saxobsidens]CCG01323.1 UDP-glucose 6-dehydrogenase [Blastococcus saxobsidens DD2]